MNLFNPIELRNMTFKLNHRSDYHPEKAYSLRRRSGRPKLCSTSPKCIYVTGLSVSNNRWLVSAEPNKMIYNPDTEPVVVRQCPRSKL